MASEFEIKRNTKGFIVTNGAMQLPGWFTTELAANSALEKYLNKQNEKLGLREAKKLKKEQD